MMKKFLIAVVFVFGLAAAYAADKPSANKQPKSSTPTVQELIGSATCESDDQCRTIAIGAKACGGPEAYVAWSTHCTNEQQLRELVEQNASERRQQIKAQGMASNCMFVTDPGAYCDLATPNSSITKASTPTQTSRGVCRLRARGMKNIQ